MYTYIHKGNMVILIVYVDDLLLMTNNEELEQRLNKLCVIQIQEMIRSWLFFDQRIPFVTLTGWFPNCVFVTH